MPRGGPDGGDGGDGGSVYVRVDAQLSTLLDYRYRREIRARSGAPGQGARRTGADGEDVELRVPVGTVVFDENAPEGAEPLADLSEPGQRFVAARFRKETMVERLVQLYDELLTAKETEVARVRMAAS